MHVKICYNKNEEKEKEMKALIGSNLRIMENKCIFSAASDSTYWTIQADIKKFSKL